MLSFRQKLVSRIFAISLIFTPLAAFGQQYMPLPPNSLVGNLLPISQPGSAITIPELVSALSSRGLVVDQITKIGNTTYSISPGDRVVATSVPFTASRTWTLPLAGNTAPGHPIMVADFAGGVTNSNALVIARAGSDTINNGTTATISAAFGAYYLVSDGVDAWNAQPFAAGGFTSLTCGTGLSGGTITTTGTCAVSLTDVTNSLGSDVLLNNTANYFDGPSMAQGTTGTWSASGTVTLTDTAGAAQIYCKLWDGTTVIASSDLTISAGGLIQTMSLSGVLASPAANIRISCRDVNSTSGKILFNTTGNSKDSTLSALRIQ